MRLTIRHKLLAILLLVNTVLIMAIYFANQAAFEKSFRDYIQQNSRARLIALVPSIRDNFARYGEDWVFHRHPAWHQLVRELRGNGVSATSSGTAPSYDSYDSPSMQRSRRPSELNERGSEPDWGGRGVRTEQGAQAQYHTDRRPQPGADRPPRGERGAHPPKKRRPPRGHGDNGGRLVFKNAAGEQVIGSLTTTRTTLWVPVHQSEVPSSPLLGYVGLEDGLVVSNRFDSLFAERQKNWFMYIAIVALIASSLLAIPFSHFLVAPVLALRRAAQNLARGDYQSNLNPDSNDELGMLARDLNTLSETLRENQQARQQWIADISHELRTPIAVFKAELEGMIDGVIDTDPAQLQSLHEEIGRLTQLVDDLHQLSMSDRGSLSYQMASHCLGELVEQTFGNHQAQLANRHFVYRLKGDLQNLMECDDRRMTQLFSNLMQNTLRYTDSELHNPGQILVTIKQQGKHTEIVWEDSSPGVDAALLDKLFDRLYRVKQARDRVSGGSGLGLAICTSIVQAHNGTISARESELGGLAVVMRFT
ncbi:ATP-binding protein [Pseudoalteromonas sp. OOF1S-7]|uniref:ATP-binding protein n=1 Tax=Pseudoalteromonas sp. OOF1S-7 TaxID=2917757 RepID=UPI001EF6174E|nr:ATP-binding protein [Pseudoalteromonas sp. OOF1S-7]MCG7533514.1 ATP-binding protein [Pseudoalteromonas sp. OOF1S-7]